jgi:hypothetical protein
MPLTLFTGFFFFIIGNMSALAEEESAKNREKNELIQSIDSLNNIQNKLYIQEISLLQDSLRNTKIKDELQNQLIDSLQNKKNEKKKQYP